MLKLIILIVFLININPVILLNKNRIIEKYENYKRYKPTWESLDTRPLPEWFDEAKIGIFLHWGVFSVPSFGSEWFWSNWKGGNPTLIKFMKENYPPNFSYQDFAKDFTAEFFDPDQWATLFKKSGAKYVVLTSKHHEGFTLWPSKYSFSWNSNDVGPHRDLIGPLASAVRRAGLTFGLYHSLFEWFNPMYISDKLSQYQQQIFVENKILPEMYELVNTYKPEIIWSDGDWEANDTYWESTKFLAWLYNDSPVNRTVVTNDRWGRGISCKHGDFYTCQDRYDPGVLQNHKWENAMTLDKKSWGYRRNAMIDDYLTTQELITLVARTVSCGGNILINVGPTKEGIIAPIFQERLLDLGQWLSINNESIYKSIPWKIQNDSSIQDVWYTKSKTLNIVYAIVTTWPKDNVLFLRSVTEYFQINDVKVILLGYNQYLNWNIVDDQIKIQFPDNSKVLSKWAWVLKIITL